MLYYRGEWEKYEAPCEGWLSVHTRTIFRLFLTKRRQYRSSRFLVDIRRPRFITGMPKWFRVSMVEHWFNAGVIGPAVADVARLYGHPTSLWELNYNWTSATQPTRPTVRLFRVFSQQNERNEIGRWEGNPACREKVRKLRDVKDYPRMSYTNVRKELRLLLVFIAFYHRIFSATPPTRRTLSPLVQRAILGCLLNFDVLYRQSGISGTLLFRN